MYYYKTNKANSQPSYYLINAQRLNPNRYRGFIVYLGKYVIVVHSSLFVVQVVDW